MVVFCCFLGVVLGLLFFFGVFLLVFVCGVSFIVLVCVGFVLLELNIFIFNYNFCWLLSSDLLSHDI